MTQRTATITVYVLILIQGILLSLPMFHDGDAAVVVFLVGTHFVVLALWAVAAAAKGKGW